MPCGEPHPRYPYPTSEEVEKLFGRQEGGEELRQRQLKQLHQEQLPRLEAMIQRATTLKDLHRFQTWRKQLIQTLRKEGVMPKTETAKCEHKRWLLTGTKQTCRSCGLTKPQPGRGQFEVAAEHRQKVTDYLKAQPGGKRGEWSEFAKAVGVSGTQLGVIVSSMLADGLISEPEGQGSMVYQFVPAKGRAAAKKLYEEQRQAEEGSPKALIPAEKLEAKRDAKARKATSKAA